MLIKCKECDEQISNKATACPHCGADIKQKHSFGIGTFLIILIIVGWLATNYATNTYETAAATAKQSNPKELISKKHIKPPEPIWTTSTSKDEMTGDLSEYATSPITKPSKKMEFPYRKVHAWLGVGCDKNNEWAYIGFNSSPNLTNTKTEDGYDSIKTRIKWNDKTEEIELIQEWGAKFIHFRKDSTAISKIETSKSSTLELKWHEQQNVYFEFTLAGSSAAVKEIRRRCLKNTPS